MGSITHLDVGRRRTNEAARTQRARQPRAGNTAPVLLLQSRFLAARLDARRRWERSGAGGELGRTAGTAPSGHAGHHHHTGRRRPATDPPRPPQRRPPAAPRPYRCCRRTGTRRRRPGGSPGSPLCPRRCPPPAGT